MSQQGTPLFADLVLGGGELSPSRPDSHGARRPPLSASCGSSVVFSVGSRESSSRRKNPVKPLSKCVSFLIPHDDKIYSPTRSSPMRNDESQSTIHGNSVCPLAVPSLQRRINSVRMKVGLAEAILQNASNTTKVSMSPERRRKHMVQLEIAKLILFVARQQNVREEMQQLGHPLGVSDAIMYHRRSIVSDIPFLAREPPPDLSIGELKRATFEMEEQLAEVKATKPQSQPTISADRVSSNLPELLWLIESMDLQVPYEQYTNLADDFSGPTVTSPVVASITEPFQKPQEEWQPPQQQKRRESPAQLTSQESSSNVMRGGVLSMLEAAGTNMLEFTRLSGDTTVVREEEDTKKEDELIGFSVEVESPGCTTVEAAGLKLLQFMYDAIDASSEELGLMNGKDEGTLAVADPGKKTQDKEEIVHSMNVTEKDACETQCSYKAFDSTTRNPDVALQLHSTNKEPGTLTTTQGEESEDQAPTWGTTTPGPESFSSWRQSTGFEVPVTYPLLQPSHPTVEVHPLRVDLYEILQELYKNFNYNYYFRQCKEKKEGARRKTKEEYSEEVARLLAGKKKTRQQNANDSQNNDDALLSTLERKISVRTPSPRRQKSTVTVHASTTDQLEENSTAAPAELPLPELLLSEAVLPSESMGVVDDGSTVFSMEIGKGILFVLKGQGNRQSRTGSLSLTNGKKNKKSPNKQGSEADKEASDKSRNAAQNKMKQPYFDRYTLYAVNQSDSPQRATVETNATKLKNLKIKALLNYTDNNKTIAVDVPPFSTISVLTLNSIKKGRRVVFDGALNFYEGAPVKNEPQAKKVIDTKRSSKLSFASLSAKIVHSVASEVVNEEVDTNVEPLVKDASAALSEEREKEDTTEVNEVPVVVAGASAAAGITEPLVQGNETMDHEEATEVGTRRVFSRHNFKPLLLNSIESTEDLGSEINSQTGSSFSENGPATKKVKKWDVNVMNATLTKPKEAATAIKRRESVRSTIETAKGGKAKDEPRKSRTSEAAGNLESATRVGERGVALSNEDDEAFENNCVVLSVLQASEWQGALTDGRRSSEKGPFLSTMVSTGSKAMNEKEQVVGEGKVNAVEGATSTPSALTSVSQRVPSAGFRQGKNKEEDIIAAALYPSEHEETLRVEEMVAGVLQRIADEEMLETGHQLETDGFSFSKKDGETPLRAGSAALWRHKMKPQPQDDQVQFGPRSELEQQPSSSTLRDGAELPSGLITEIQKLQSPSATAGIKVSGESKEGGSIIRAFTPNKVSSGNSVATVDVSQQPSVDLVEKSSAQLMSLDGRYQPSATMGETSASVLYCEGCLASHHHHHTVFPTSGINKAGEDARTPIEIGFGMEQLSCMESSKGGIAVEELRAESVALPALEEPEINSNALLVGVDKAKRRETPIPRPPSRQGAQGRDMLSPEMPITPTRQYAYTDVRPGGRVAVLAPKTMETMGPTPLSSLLDKGKASGKPLRAEGIAENIRISLHGFARQATSHSNQLPISQLTPTTASMTAAITGKRGVNDMRYAKLPPLSLYGPDTLQDVDDFAAGEEEAKALFLQDPARYDCVVDDLIRRATMKVQEEEGREKLRRDAVARAMGEGKLKENLVYASNRSQRHAITHRQVPLTALQFGGSIAVGTSGASMDSTVRHGVHLSQRESLTDESLHSLLSQRQHGDAVKSGVTNELNLILEEQRRAKKIVAYVLIEMRRMWQRRELESKLAIRAAIDRFIYRSVLFSWQFERRRVLNVQKLIHLLDRKTGRVGGWIPFYVRDRVIEDRFVWEPVPPHLSHPLRVVHRAMCLAKQQRMYPLRIVRREARKNPSQQILYGYKRTLVEPSMTSAVRYRLARRFSLRRALSASYVVFFSAARVEGWNAAEVKQTLVSVAVIVLLVANLLMFVYTMYVYIYMYIYLSIGFFVAFCNSELYKLIILRNCAEVTKEMFGISALKDLSKCMRCLYIVFYMFFFVLCFTIM
ncbi:hypothetical protein TraAM80_01403 [Trypanosoma rangeli]|uniref:Transmembrane protein n=1 Tax=Trypanosoma rangeli TaxID=5698 RepID=A0A422NZ41_TRYRA|nr:uncharacterized protein TraAM80_01403 [Trypanosoma rangeli]RNF10699.1 hypothetical protein TraAM80_01403 [Trypanosoma rangeli]|eukprot:RNF10699.1 hypothetical protein TraAM80_01403 [Trypanosoma rangeli]